MGVVSLGMLCGSVLPLLLGKSCEPQSLLRRVMLPFLLVAFLNVALACSSLGSSHEAWWLSVLSAFLMAMAMGLFGPACQALYLSPFRNITGTAAGTAALMQTLGMAVGSTVASQIWQRNPQPCTFFAVLAAGNLMVQLWFWPLLGLRRRVKESAPLEASSKKAAGPVDGIVEEA